MERGKDKKNILIAGLLLVVLAMSVGFALLSSELEVNATGTVSADWAVQFETGSLTQTNVTDGVTDITAELDVDGMVVTLDADFEKPGDSLSYRVTIENTGSIDAYLKRITAEWDENNSDAIRLSYKVTNKAGDSVYAQGNVAGTTLTEITQPISTATLLKKEGEIVDNNYLDITLEYLSTTEQIASGASASYSLFLYYEQPEATTDNE